MGTPEDMAAEKHFTPPTLTEMLRSNLSMESEGDAGFMASEQELHTIKSTFKDWLRTVGLPQQNFPYAQDHPSEESTRQLLITLVDEP